MAGRKPTGHEGIERGDFEHFFGAIGENFDWQAEFADNCVDGPRFFLRRFAQVHGEIGPQNCENDAWNAAAGADVENPLALFQQLAEFVSIDDIAADEFFQRRMPREIHPFVPQPEEPPVAIEQLDLLGGRRDLLCGEGRREFGD